MAAVTVVADRRGAFRNQWSRRRSPHGPYTPDRFRAACALTGGDGPEIVNEANPKPRE